MSDNIRVMIVCGDGEPANRYKRVLSQNPGIKVVGECSSCDGAVENALESEPDIVIIDGDSPRLDSIRISEVLTSSFPGITAIITSSEGGEENLKRAMSAGAREYLLKPYPDEVLINTVVSHYEKQSRNMRVLHNRKLRLLEHKSQIITVFSTKGGVGKSTLASNLAVAIAERTNGKVALLDLDLQFGDIPVMLNLFPEKNIADLAEKIGGMNPELLEEYLIEHESGVRVLPAPMNPEYAEYINGQIVERIIKTLLESYRYIIIDTAPIFNDINLMAMDVSDKIFFVTTLDLSTIKNVKSGLQVMKTLKYTDEKIGIVLNRYHKQFGISSPELEKILGMRVTHTIPEDNATVISSANKGIPFVLAQKNSRATRCVGEIAHAVMGEEQQPEKRLLGKLLRRS